MTVEAGALLLDASLLLRVAEDAPVAIAAVQGPDHRFIFANTAYRRQLGLGYTSLIGHTFREVVPELAECMLPLLNRVYESARPVIRRGYRSDVFPRRPIAVWDIDLVPVLGGADEVRGVVLMLHDITGSANARAPGYGHERDEDDAGRILEGLMRYIPDGIVIADAPDGTIRMVSAYSSTVTGRAASELVGVSVQDQAERWGVLRPDGSVPSPEDMPLARAIHEGEVATDEEWLLQRADGERVPVMCNSGPIRNASGAITGGVVAWRDMRAFKSEMEARRRAEDSLRVALEAAGMASWDLDLTDGSSRRSPNHDQFFGYDEPREEWGVSDFLQHVVPEEQPSVAAQFEQAADQGGLQFECRIRRVDSGDIRWIAVKGRVCSDNVTERPRRLAAILQDVTRSKAAEAAVRRATEESRRADLALNEVVRARYQALTPRQRDVMALVVSGHPNKVIAHRLGISERTVEGHRARVMERMCAQNLADLVRMAGALGVGPCAPAPGPAGTRLAG